MVATLRRIGVGRNHPLLLAMRLENVFLASARLCRWRRSTMCSSTTFSSRSQAPSGKAFRGRRGSARSVLLPPRRRKLPPGGVRRVVFAANTASNPSSTSWRLVRSTVAMLVTSAAAIRLSLQPSPASDMSAFN